MQQRIDDIAIEMTGSGPPALFIHGVPATHTLWAPLVERLSDRRLCILPDLPGFGGSSIPDHPPSIVDTARTILALLDRLEIERLDVVGHSYGGAVAIALASLAPHRVRTLAALTPLTPATPPLARLTQRRRVMRFISRIWRSAPGPLRRFFLVNIWTRINYGVAWQPERARQVARESDRGDMVEMIRERMTCADFESYEILLRTLDRSHLLLCSAGHDRVIPCDQQLALCHRCGSARHHHFPRGGHLLMWQYPDELAELIGELWKSGG